ncbi:MULTISPECIES: PBP1A family penicillin-binding protein [unclassified Virgibacillus]|uniref:PBP1A family penicillin-binding protein n=1 Tax=unclassified Virgibacillus TaxID=2620237 RepID=UPI0024DEE278|nr:PBP1A family penicillin-binding protein [Virgibacillus sp. LDC-1]
MADNSQSRIARRKQKKSKKKPFWKKIMRVLFVLLIAIGLGVGVLFTYYIATAPEIDASKLSDPFSTKIYDQDENLIGDFGSEKRTKVEFDDLPKVLIDAVTATEDSRFFDHSGIDLKRIGGAVVANVKRGFGAEGASTITQQVVEKSFLTPEKKIKLKVQEMWLALKLEREYSKEQILEMYLNKIFYGSNAWGVAKASEVYFGKTDLHELTLPEAAILAGLPQRPSAYNPYENPDLMKERMNTVLKLMVRHGKITQAEADEASQVDIPSLLAGDRPDSTPYEAFIQAVDKEVKEKLDANIYTDGLKIYTTLDPDAQKHVESLLTDSENNPIAYNGDDKLQAGLVVLDTKNGAVRAVGGRRNSKGTDEWNYAIQGGKQPGSTFKPILDYGPAIEYKKWSTYHQLNDDKPYPIAGTNKTIKNWNLKYQGWMSARYAMQWSLNVPAVKTFEEVGAKNAMEFAKGLGIPFKDDKINLTDAIGGAETNVNPLQMAGAFRAFGNEGIYNDPYTVTKVEFPDGRTVELSPDPKAAMSDYTAYMITDMLKTVVKEGTGRSANVPGLHVAGKTGTTNDDKDIWFTGYTTDYTVSVWTGYEEDVSKKNTVVANQLFKETMAEISKGKDSGDFKKPDSVVRVAVEKGSNPAALPSKYTPKSQIVTELFVKGTEPKKKSDKYDRIDPVSKLKAAYNEDSNSIQVTWNHDVDEDIVFNVSASVNGGSMQELSSTEERTIEITEVEPGAEYQIQVIAVSKDDSANKSEAKSTKVKVPEAEEEEEIPDEEEENEAGNIGAVQALAATYNENKEIDVSWQYNGPPAQFEVIVNNQKQIVQSNGVIIEKAQAGQTYTITVTPIGRNGANEGKRGQPASTEITVPAEQESE